MGFMSDLTHGGSIFVENTLYQTNESTSETNFHIAVILIVGLVERAPFRLSIYFTDIILAVVEATLGGDLL